MRTPEFKSMLTTCTKNKSFSLSAGRVFGGLLVLLSVLTVQMQAQLASWNASSLSGGGPQGWAPTTANANLTIVGLTRGGGLGTATAGSAWGANNWAGAANQDATFMITANAGYQVSFSSMSLAYRRSGTGPGTGLFQYAFGAASTSYTTIATLSYPNSSSTTGVPIGPFSMTSFPDLQNVAPGTVVKFRIYNTGGASAGTWYVNSTNALSIAGSVVAVPSCTTPTGLAASNISTNSADLNWNSLSGINGYEYAVDQTASAPTGAGTAITTNSYSASALTNGAVYYMHVRTDCGSSSFSGWATTSFTTASSCMTPTVTSITGNTLVCAGQNLNLAANVTGTGPYTYTWTGTGSFSSVSVSNPTVMSSASGDYSVTVANACGTTSAAVTVSVAALPTISANTATVCPAGSATLTATGANTYTWSTSQTTTSITVNPTVATNYSVTGRDLNGCTNTYTTAVSVYTLPVVSANTASVCPAGSATLTASGANTYSWNPSIGLSSATGTSVTASPASTTIYTVTGQDMNGCKNTYSTSVTVYTLPAVAANSPSICPGNTATLTASGANTYSWSTSQTTASITVNPSANTVYTVTGTDLNGCVNTRTTTVTINALPSVSANSPSVCPGATATLSATGANTYSWSTSQTTQSITVNPSVVTVYTVTGTDLNGCMNTFTTAVNMNALPMIGANTPSVCPGATATLTATGANTYTWSTTQTTPSITVNPAATTMYTVSGTDMNGCTNSYTATVVINALPSVGANSPSICVGGTATLTASGANTYSWSTTQTTTSITVNPTATTVYTVTGTDASNCVNTFTTAVTVNAAPAMTVNSSTICAGSNATLTAGGVTTYTWNTGSNNASITPSPVATTVYTVSGNMTGCPVTVVKTTTVTVNTLPSVSITPFSSALCNTSTTVNLVAIPTGGSFSGTGIVGNAFNPQAAGTGTFTINYTYTGANSCSNVAHATIMVNNCTGIEETFNNASFSVYPNPAQEVVYVKFENNSVHAIHMYNVAGSLVYASEDSEALHTINLNDFSKGLYILKVTSEGSQISKKILVQ